MVYVLHYQNDHNGTCQDEHNSVNIHGLIATLSPINMTVMICILALVPLLHVSQFTYDSPNTVLKWKTLVYIS